MSKKRKYTPADPNGADNAYAARAGMSQTDQEALERYGQQYNAYADQERQALSAAADDGERAVIQARYQTLKDSAHAQAEAIRAKYGYSGGADGSEYRTAAVTSVNSELPDLTASLKQLHDQAAAQQTAQIDYAVEQGSAALERAEEEAQAQLQTQQDQVDHNEALALDDQALYAEVRGDRGGIGQAQHGSIRAAALDSRRAIQTQRTQLSTDTARQIADLRAQGEFQKADALLSLSQSYLQQLTDLEQWSAEYRMEGEQFNAKLEQWRGDYGLELQKLLYDRADAAADRLSDQTSALAQSGLASLEVGVRPSAAQQQAMGCTDQQITAALELFRAKRAEEQRKAYTSGSSGGTSGSGSGTSTSVTLEAIRLRNLTAAGMAALNSGVRPTEEQRQAIGYTEAQVDRAITMYWRAQAQAQRKEELEGIFDY